MPPSPAALASEAFAAGFGAVARLRHARAVHPHGPAWPATATVGPVDGVPALARRRDVEATVRLSRSFDVADHLPDVLGVAVRLHDLHGPERHQDVLVVSCVPGPVANPIPTPSPDWTWPTYSSLLPLRIGERLGFLGARSAVSDAAKEGLAVEGARRAAAQDGLAFDLTWAPVGGTWRPLGSVRVDGPELSAERAEALRFDPVLHSGPGLQLAGRALRDLRRRAYRSSRAARPLARP
ncbi:hypothetical protein [Conexibacter sp. SYSU D00693]|uniref:hypothetical protein n=1 Tax=Conexibacter sp. SYSU D00693 TaxID=2812560 RepID=UPI00196B4816|nr:hypothetical protein [Conexibacter sp. SYSU D00693]